MEEDDDIVAYFLSSCMRREMLPDFSSLDFSKHLQTFTRLFQEIRKKINDFSKDVRPQGKQRLPILTSEKRANW